MFLVRRLRQLGQCLEDTTETQRNQALFHFIWLENWSEAWRRTILWVTMEMLCTTKQTLPSLPLLNQTEAKLKRFFSLMHLSAMDDRVFLKPEGTLFSHGDDDAAQVFEFWIPHKFDCKCLILKKLIYIFLKRKESSSPLILRNTNLLRSI